jgi:hypothetical protein
MKRTAGVLAPAVPVSLGAGADEVPERRQRAAYLYVVEGLSLERTADELACSVSTVVRELEALGVERRRRKHPAPEPRVCARDGCDVVFTPTATQVLKGFGKFCSRECDHEAHRIHAKPVELVCALDGCDVVFTPSGYQLAQGWGLYHSRLCARRGVKRGRRKGRLVECIHCQKQVWRYECEVRELNFCSYEHWGKYRFHHGLAGMKKWLSPATCGKLRHEHKSRWGGFESGGRPRASRKVPDYAEKARLVLELKRTHPRLGERPIADRVGLSRRQVRTILGDL